jgi:uncharacterized protein YdeI (YjbR/CyaY-like superfamily)
MIGIISHGPELRGKFAQQVIVTKRGLAEMEAARKDGRWDAAYEPQASIGVQEDLQAKLDANPRARAVFATLSSQNRYAILYRIADAKKPETRARRIEQFVDLLAEGKTLH